MVSLPLPSPWRSVASPSSWLRPFWGSVLLPSCLPRPYNTWARPSCLRALPHPPHRALGVHGVLQDPPGCGAVAGVGRGGTELVLTRNFPRQPFGRAGGEGTAARAGRAHACPHVLKCSLGARCLRGRGWGQLGTICRGSPGICPHGGFIPPAVPAMVRGHSWVPGGAQVGTGGCPPLTVAVPQPPATSTAGFGALWPCQQGDAVASWTPRLGSPEPSVAPLPQILPERWQSLSAFTPPPSSTASHAGVTPGVPDSQPQQQLPPGGGKVRSIPHSQGDRGKL